MLRAKSARLASVLVLAAGLAAVEGCSAESSTTTYGPGPCSDCSCQPCGDDVAEPVNTALRPTFAPTVRAAVPPPPISGGTLLVMRDGHTAVAADPDRDVVYVVDVSKQSLTATVSLKAGDEPGRVVEDGAGHVHVALRGGGALVTIDPAAGAVLSRRAACPAPRGVAWDATTDLVWTACATGELVALPASGGPPAHSFVVERDLRDVVVTRDALVVSKFRAAQVLWVSPKDGTITARFDVPDVDTTSSSHVAWRMVADPGGFVAIVHQAHSTEAVQTTVQGGYGGSTSSPTSVVESVVTRMSVDGQAVQTVLDQVTLPVDVAVGSDGALAVVAPGNAFVGGLDTVVTVPAAGGAVDPMRSWSLAPGEQPTAVAYDGAGNLIVQTRAPTLYVIPPVAPRMFGLQLSTQSRDDTGHDVFHTQAGGLIACASCHPEGGDDGFVWHLDGEARRTPSLRGTIAGTAPYHWPGDQHDLDALVADVYSQRMNGATLQRDQLDALEGWVQSIPAPPPPSWIDAASAQRGKALFESASVGCALCHAGPKLTNNQTTYVGTGGGFQVPPLVGVGWRTPLLHDGCAGTIADRFGKCATPGHGSLTGLSSQDVADLGTYLESL